MECAYCETHDADCEQVLNAESDQAAIAVFEAEVAAYKAQWPSHCEACSGWGFESGWNSDFSCDEWYTCQSCYDLADCPRCAGKLRFVERDHCDYGKCQDCEWRDPATPDEFSPDQFGGMPDRSPGLTECSCWFNRIDR